MKSLMKSFTVTVLLAACLVISSIIPNYVCAANYVAGVVSNYASGSVLSPDTDVILETITTGAVIQYIVYPTGERPSNPFIWNTSSGNRVSIKLSRAATTIEAFAEVGGNDLSNNYKSAVAVFNYTISQTPIYYLITFKDWNGSVLSSQSISRGQSAIPPTNPYRAGYTFKRWDGSYTNVQTNMTITAQYERTNPDPFTMGVDNYSFSNTGSSFGYYSGYSIPLERFLEIYSPTMANTYYKVFSPWFGNCYGFAASAYAFETYKLNHSSYQSGVNNTFAFSTPYSPNSPVSKVIELYQISQMLDEPQREEYGSNYDNLKALVSVANSEDGLIVILKGTAGGHAVIAYGVEYIDGYKYLLKIYDSNQPHNKDLRIEIDTSKSNNTGWYFMGDTQNYNSRLHSHISFINGETIHNAIEKAKNTKSNNSAMQILAPANSEITNNMGIRLEDIAGAYKVVPNALLPDENSAQTSSMELWFVPDDVYTIKAPQIISDSVIVFNADESFEITFYNGNAKIECTVGNESFARVIEAEANTSVDLSYITNDTINNPATIRAQKGNEFKAIVSENGKLVISGNVGITIISGAQNIEISE